MSFFRVSPCRINIFWNKSSYMSPTRFSHLVLHQEKVDLQTIKNFVEFPDANFPSCLSPCANCRHELEMQKGDRFIKVRKSFFAIYNTTFKKKKERKKENSKKRIHSTFELNDENLWGGCQESTIDYVSPLSIEILIDRDYYNQFIEQIKIMDAYTRNYRRISHIFSFSSNQTWYLPGAFDLIWFDLNFLDLFMTNT